MTIGRYAVVWWGWLDWGLVWWRPSGNWGLIYAWSLRVGPLELRKHRRTP